MASQTIVVIAIIAVAIGYLSLRTLRGVRRSRSTAAGCGDDDCGCGH